MRLLVAAAVLIGVGDHACGDNTEALTYEQYIARANDVQCERDLRCGVLATRAQCERPNYARYAPSELIIDSLASGRIAFDEVAAATCLHDYANLTCNPWSFEYRDFGCPLWTPLLHAGDACLFDGECSSGLCGMDDCESACCAGSCDGEEPPAPAQLGESCEELPCAEGFCNKSDVCVPYVQPEATCESPYDVCTDGYECNGVCVKVALTGEPCGGVCASPGDVCDPTTKHCVPVGQLGDECSWDPGCTIGMTCVSAQCRYADRPLGSSCDYDDRLCATPGAICSFDEGKCELPRSLGVACGLWTECESRNCDYANGVCIEQCSLGE